MPQARPAPGVAATPPQPGTKPVSPPQTGNGGWPAAAVAAGRAECAALLAGLPLTYKPIDPIGQEGGCGTPAPIEISAVAGVTLAPPATETCAMAAALASWVTEDVQPMARQRLGTEVTGIRTATSYACRFRNNGSSGKMSEHSKANALDMSGFTFAKQVKVTVGGSDNWGDGLLAATGLWKISARRPAPTSQPCSAPAPTPITATTSMWTCCSARAVTASASKAWVGGGVPGCARGCPVVNDRG